jgi:hypothetical protein
LHRGRLNHADFYWGGLDRADFCRRIGLELRSRFAALLATVAAAAASTPPTFAGFAMRLLAFDALQLGRFHSRGFL